MPTGTVPFHDEAIHVAAGFSRKHRGQCSGGDDGQKLRSPQASPPNRGELPWIEVHHVAIFRFRIGQIQCQINDFAA